MPTSNLRIPPPLSSNGVFFVSASILIDAPRAKVWSVLLDFPKYREWNPFVRGITVVSKTNRVPLDDQTLREGKYLLMSPVHVPPTMEDSSVWLPTSSFNLVTAVDHENYSCSWISMLKVPRWLLYTDRWQALSTAEGGETRYETIEVFTGLAAYILKIFMANGLKKGFVAMAEGLKNRSEAQTL